MAPAPPLDRVCLVILDGWGLAPPGPGNAVELADTPVFDRLWAEHPAHAADSLRARGRPARRPDGQLRGRPPEPRRRRDRAPGPDAASTTRSPTAASPPTRCCGARARVARERGRLHLLGLVSAGGVHASMDHLRALIELAAARGRARHDRHAFTDGRDTQPGLGRRLRGRGRGAGAGRGSRPSAAATTRWTATSRWERTQLAYDALVDGRRPSTPLASGEAAVRAAYERGETDEFIVPTLVGEEGRIREGDAVVFFNFRPDRARQLLRAAGRRASDLHHADRVPRGLALSGRVPARAADGHAGVAARRARDRPATRGGDREVRARDLLLQRRRGGPVSRARSASLVDSPRDVPTYDHKPEMSARAGGRVVRRALGGGRLRLRDHQLRQPGHGRAHGLDPGRGRRPCETVDGCLGQVVEAVHASGGACIVTADHGNADNMLEPDGSPNTAHSLNPVPLIVTASVGELREGGILADVAPDRAGPDGTSGAARNERDRASRLSVISRSTPATGQPARAFFVRRTATSARRRSCRSPRPRR